MLIGIDHGPTMLMQWHVMWWQMLMATRDWQSSIGFIRAVRKMLHLAEI